ncbi:MAG: carbohydrate-binding domain-containing protein [Ruminococcus sp.]|nr:carbohydrate-binding domain-containing protein [Ruminococcus sp.]
MKALVIKKAAAAVTAALMMSGSWGALGAFDYDESQTVSNTFTFTNEGITASNESGSGYKIKDNALTINAAGVYEVSGTCAEGSIKIKASTTGVVLILSDIHLTSAETAPLTVGKNAQAEIVIKGENTLTDAEDPANETSTDTEVADAFEGAAVKVKSAAEVTFTGTGSLTADGSECKNAIKGGATSSIIFGEDSSDTFTINAKAANNAVAADGSVTVNSGELTLTATGDGLKASPEEDDTESLGIVTINGGSVGIVSGEDGIQADKGFSMSGGSVDIVCAKGHSYNSTLGDTSAKGIKSDAYINISGGEINIDAADDAIHLNGTAGTEELNITGGKLTLQSGDDAIHSDYLLNMGTQGGTDQPEIDVLSAVEGIEGAVICMYSGTGEIYTSDDGINAANGDLTDYSFKLDISGGTWYINAGGDGLDSNGDINVSGGYTEVFGSADGGNAAIDYGDFNSSFNVTGGTVIGIGNSQMVVTPTSGSYLIFGQQGRMGGAMGGHGGQGGQQGMTPPDGQQGGMTPPDAQGGESQQTAISITKGTKIEIRDSSNNVVYIGTGVKSADSIVFASELLDADETYTLYLDGNAAATATVSAGSQQQGGGGMPWEQSQYSKGDVNRDGKVDVKDAMFIIAYANQKTAPKDQEQYRLADLNNDNSIDFRDAMMIVQVLKGKIVL